MNTFEIIEQNLGEISLLLLTEDDHGQYETGRIEIDLDSAIHIEVQRVDEASTGPVSVVVR